MQQIIRGWIAWRGRAAPAGWKLAGCGDSTVKCAAIDQFIAISSGRGIRAGRIGWNCASSCIALQVEDFNAPLVDRDHAFDAKLGEHAIEMRDAQAERVAHHLLDERQVEGEFIGHTDHGQPRMNFEQKMRQTLDRRSAADVDDALGIIGRLLRRQPAQQQTELRAPVAKRDECFERTNLQRHVAKRR